MFQVGLVAPELIRLWRLCKTLAATVDEPGSSRLLAKRRRERLHNQGDVVLLPFPPTNQLTNRKQVKFKNRPAVIISTDWFFYLRGDYVVVALTSQAPKDCFDLKIRDYEQAGMVKPTVARIGKYLTIHPIIIIKKLGQLTEYDLNNILRRVNWPFGFQC